MWSVVCSRCRENEELIARLAQPKAGSRPLAFQHAFPQSQPRQLLLLLKKNMLTYWRSPFYNTVRFTFTIMLGLIIGAIYWGLGSSRSALIPFKYSRVCPLNAGKKSRSKSCVEIVFDVYYSPSIYETSPSLFVSSEIRSVQASKSVLAGTCQDASELGIARPAHYISTAKCLVCALLQGWAGRRTERHGSHFCRSHLPG